MELLPGMSVRDKKTGREMVVTDTSPSGALCGWWDDGLKKQYFPVESLIVIRSGMEYVAFT